VESGVLAQADSLRTIADSARVLEWDWFPGADERTSRRVLAGWLPGNSNLSRLVLDARYRLRPPDVTSFESTAALPGRQRWDARPEIRTMFKRRDMVALTVNRQGPHFAEGPQVALRVFAGMRQRLASREIRLGVVLVPAKSSVYMPIMRDMPLRTSRELERPGALDADVCAPSSRVYAHSTSR
jgi:hypothetical protein